MTTLSTSLPNEDVKTIVCKTRTEVRTEAYEFMNKCALSVQDYVFVIWNETIKTKKSGKVKNQHDCFLIVSDKRLWNAYYHIKRVMTNSFPIDLNVFAFESFEDACLFIKDLKQ
jgi:ATP sulfurylase